MLKTFMFFLKQLASIYNINMSYDGISGNTIYNLRIIEAGQVYYFETLQITVNSINIVRKVFDVTICIGDMQIRVSNNGQFLIHADKISLEKIKRILGPSVLDRWESNDNVNIRIENDTFIVTGDCKIHGPEITGEYIRAQLGTHLGEYINYPRYIKDSLLVSEDEDFYQHWGVHYRNVQRMFDINSQHNKIIGGGSSLTCQLMKNTFLTGEKTIRRKIIEAILAVLTERYYKVPKDEIFDIYLSMLEMAPGVYGLNEGSVHYFGKPVSNIQSHELHVLQYIIPRPLFVPEAININSFAFRTKVRIWLSNVWKEQPKVIKFAPPYQHIYL